MNGPQIRHGLCGSKNERALVWKLDNSYQNPIGGTWPPTMTKTIPLSNLMQIDFSVSLVLGTDSLGMAKANMHFDVGRGAMHTDLNGLQKVAAKHRLARVSGALQHLTCVGAPPRLPLSTKIWYGNLDIQINISIDYHLDAVWVIVIIIKSIRFIVNSIVFASVRLDWKGEGRWFQL